MTTIKIYRFIGGQKGRLTATAASLTEARIYIAHQLSGHRIITSADKASDEELDSSSVGHYEAYRQRDLYNFSIGKTEELNPIYISAYYYTEPYD